MAIGKRTFHFDQQTMDYFAEIVRTGRVSYGVYSKELEQNFAKVYGQQYGVLSNSGTSSLQVALQAMKESNHWPDRAEVIVPAITFVATINVVLHNRLTPVLVDVDPLTYNMDAHLLEQAITERTVAILPAHLFGLMADMVKIKSLADERGSWFYRKIGIIEDSCETALATIPGDIPPGVYADIVCFSFYMAHHIQAGVGGIGLTSNEDYAKRMRSLVNHGMKCDTLDGVGFDPNRDFIFETIGHSFRITEFEAAMALAQLNNLGENVAARRMVAHRLTSKLTKLGKYLQLPFTPDGYTHSYMMYPIVCRNTETAKHSRDGVRQHLTSKGIGTRNMLPIINQPCYRGLWNPADYPVARWIDENGFYIGIHPSMSEEDLQAISEAFYEYFKR